MEGINWTKARIGTVHSLVCHNDGVSIVINQIVDSLHRYLGVPMENFHFACGRYGGDLYENVYTHDALWHKDEVNTHILEHYGERPPADLREKIEARVDEAERFLSEFFHESGIDVLIAHNACHPVNFIYSLALHRIFDAAKKQGKKHPLYTVWWHDSHMERERFYQPNEVVAGYVGEGIPGPHVDRIVFINRGQWAIAEGYFERLTSRDPAVTARLRAGHTVVPNTCDIPRNWTEDPDPTFFAPKLDDYNRDFLREIGIEGILEERGKSVSNALILLQHTRVVPRKRIDHAIDFAFAMADRLKKRSDEKVVVLLVSGPSGDELGDDVAALNAHFARLRGARPDLDVHLIWGEDRILSKREVHDGVKFYDFAEIPEVVAYYGGLGTYFSEVEGFGNNLLELLSCGVPPVVRRYPVYETDIAVYGFEIPSTPDGTMTDALLDGAVRIVTDIEHRKAVVGKNARLLEENLAHRRIADNLKALFE